LLEDLIDEVKHLKEISTLPEKPDYEFWDKWLITTVKHFVVPSSIYGSGRYL
jgi:hypothetical protein